MSEVPAHPLGPLPWTLANPDGTLRKTNKASLAKELHRNVQAADAIPQPSACVIDGMALVQRLKGGQKTFAEIAESLLSMALNEGTSSDRIDVIFDDYRDDSIKSVERENRGEGRGSEFRNLQADHQVKQWRKFLCSSRNKQALIVFVTKEWQKEKYADKLSGKTLVVTCGREAYQLSSGVVERLTNLDSSQEEADTRLLLHAAHVARSQFVTVIIVSEDTDVLVLCLAFKSFIPSSMFIKCSSHARVKYLDVSRMVGEIGASTCKALPGFHAFTGCDTVSAFQGRGKVLVFRIMAKDQGFQEVFQGLGREWQLSNELYRDLQRFTSAMYCKNAGTNEVNELRYRLFCLKKGDVDSNQLPPCDDSLRKHALRANYQAAIWKRGLQRCPLYLPLLDVAGALKMVGWRLIGWMAYQPRKQFWNCCLANAAGPVSFRHVPVWQMA